MKILVTTLSVEDNKKIVATQWQTEETGNIKHELIELEKLPEKEGYIQIVIYDEKKKQFKLEYEALPKTQEQILDERLNTVEKAIAETLHDKKDKIIEDELSELG